LKSTGLLKWPLSAQPTRMGAEVHRAFTSEVGTLSWDNEWFSSNSKKEGTAIFPQIPFGAVIVVID